jgi:Rps23 Pro-64 3,4-dihydroxylase Tpa1-like proline 4-hydroxylase
MTGSYWAYKIRKDIFVNTPIYQELLEMTNEHLGKMPWELVEAYVNSNQYGDNSYIHKDGNTYDNAVTCLVYLNETWTPDFSGETLFYNSDNDAIVVTSPKFKRIVIFDGQISHRASPPSRICPLRRLVLVVKFGSNGVKE